MKVLFDYTNWKGVREWREVRPWMSDVFLVGIGDYNLPDGYIECNVKVIHVAMMDRDGARRTLKFDKIHAIKIEE